MKIFNFQMPHLAIAALATSLAAGNLLGQESSTTVASAAQPTAVSSSAAPQLSYGVPEVLQLSQAKIGDSTIINYIHNSGNNYGLNAAQIIYLRQQGVSDSVVNAMLNQRSLNAEVAASQPADSGAAAVTTATTTQPAVTYVQTVPSSSVYVVPDTQTYYYNSWLAYHSPYYCYYPAYSYSYCWPGSTVSVSFIGSRGWVGYRGGWHGGGWHTSGGRYGGWHNAGHWHR